MIIPAMRVTLAHLDLLKAQRQEAEAFRPVVRESAKKAQRVADDAFIAARLDYHREVLGAP